MLSIPAKTYHLFCQLLYCKHTAIVMVVFFAVPRDRLPLSHVRQFVNVSYLICFKGARVNS